MNQNGSFLLPVAPAARIKRSKTCSNCGAHAPSADPRSPLLECRFDPPNLVVLPAGNGMVRPTSIFKAVEPDWWCKKWCANIEEVASLGDAAQAAVPAK